ncbi:hypothetical protein [Kaistia sp. MMO-174]|uniref:hypothetical protein n=1 Tax=Kaistia sp. MMO-174 TaxID=3081256 RepID=UPI0030166208
MRKRQLAPWFLGGAIAGIIVTGTWVVGWDAVFRGVDRWQTLLTGLLAVGAAIWASRPVFQQLDQMRRQSAASAVGTFSSIAQRMEDEVARLASTEHVIRSCQDWLNVLRYEAQGTFAHSGELRDELRESSKRFEIEVQYYRQNGSRHSRSSPVNDDRWRFINQIDDACMLFSTLARDYWQITSWHDDVEGPNLSAEQREAAFVNCQAGLEKCFSTMLNFKASLMESIVKTWRMVRNLEDAVIDERGAFSA